MAKKRKYSKSAGKDVKREMHRYKKGKAKSGPGGKGGKVKSRKQAIAKASRRLARKERRCRVRNSLTATFEHDPGPTPARRQRTKRL